LRVRLSTQTEGLAVSSRWARLKLSPAAQDYLAPLAPGMALPASGTTPEPATAETATVTEQRAYFALLTAEVVAMDWLELRATGHRRALFESDGARWVTP
jgi:pyridoxamine 5'-phosphate oxidase